MAVISRTWTLCAATALLAGCQSPLLEGWSFGKAREQRSTENEQLAGIVALEEGRALLRSGRVSAAVASFRIARLDPATAAEANNGLGVAYAKVGRPDLADRYFRAAIALDPDDTRFAANLLRMQHGVMMARRDASQMEAGQATTLAASTAPAPRGPIHIRTRTDIGAAPAMKVVYRAPRPEPDQAETGPDLNGENAPQADAPSRVTLAAGPRAREILIAQ